MVAALPGLTVAQAAVNNQASTAVANSLPGGGAIGVGISYGMFRAWGFDDAAIGLYAAITGIWNNLVKFGMPIVAVALLALEGGASGSLVTGALAGVVALIVSLGALFLLLWKESFARRIGSGLGRVVSFLRKVLRKDEVENWDDKAADFRSRTVELLRDRWLALSVTTLISHVSLYAVLLVTLRLLGVQGDEVTWIEVLGVYSFARLVSALPITPGGVGVAELSYVTGLVVLGCPKPEAVAGVLLFRTLTYLLQIPLGLPAYLVWKKRPSWREGSGDEKGKGKLAMAGNR
jgi:uncharacterized protein (TIRG00374 family)